MVHVNRSWGEGLFVIIEEYLSKDQRKSRMYENICRFPVLLPVSSYLPFLAYFPLPIPTRSCQAVYYSESVPTFNNSESTHWR